MPAETVQTSAKPSRLARFRSTAFRAAPRQIDRDQKVIVGAALCTRGEALGHGLWLDSAFIDQITALAEGTGARGLKARFTHPGLCADGLGTYLGRWKSCVRDGDVLRGTLHLSPTAHTTPKGDLAGYVLDLADDDPSAFGTSIVFACDRPAMEKFMLDHGGQWEEDGWGNQSIVGFESPDPDNKENLPHARCAELLGCDVVDEPAANPSGFFGRGDELAAKASAVLAFLFDVPNTPAPDPEAFNGLDPQRARVFVREFLSAHGLYVAPRSSADSIGATILAQERKNESMAKEQEDAKLAEKTRAKALREAYPNDPAFALEAIENDWSVEQSRAHFADKLEARVEELTAKVATLEADLSKAQVDLAKAKSKPAPASPALTHPEVEPLDAGREASTAPSFAAVVEELQENQKMSKAEAIRFAARKHPDLHKAWLNS